MKLFFGAFIQTVVLLAAGTDDLRLRTQLAGGSIAGLTPAGRVDFRARPSRGAEVSFSVEVEDINLPAGTVLEVQINGRTAGKLTVSVPPVRGGELELNSRDGDLTPQLKAGDVITVRGANGVLLSGAIQTRALDDVLRNPAAQPIPVSNNPSGNLSRAASGLAGGSIAGVTPSGHVDFRQRGNDLQLTVEVEDVNLPIGTVLDVEVDGRVIGQIKISGVGRGGELELNTRDGALVQQLRPGAVVIVKAPGRGAVLSGVAQPVSPVSPATSSSNSAAGVADDSARLRSGLTGGAVNGVRPFGHIDFRTQPGRSSTRLNVVVEDVNLPAGTVLEVEVDGRVVGRITLDALRRGELELNTRDGAVVDKIKAGANVVVRAPGRGAILSGAAQVRSIDAASSSVTGGSSSSSGNGGSNGSSGSGNSGSGSSGSGNSGSGNSGSGSSGSGNSGSGSSGGGSGSGHNDGPGHN